MIIKPEDIARYRGNVEVARLGVGTVQGFNDVTMFKPAGVVLIAQYTETFDRFIVGALNELGVLEEKREFAEKTEEDFFKATAYFEELIQSRMPQQKQDNPPPLMKFYFYKPSLGKDCVVIIEGLPPINILSTDVLNVFSPPRTKPLGRLNMLDDSVTGNSDYDIIRGKFALAYNLLDTDEEATKLGVDKNDMAIYDMTPYSDGTNTQHTDEPPEVGDDKIDPRDIEDEHLTHEPPQPHGEPPPPPHGEPPRTLPRVGDTVKIRDNYGVVVSVDDQTKKVVVRKMTQQEAMDWLQQSQGGMQMALGGEIKSEDDEFLYLEIDENNSELQILSPKTEPHGEPPPPQDEPTETPFFRIRNTASNTLDMLLFYENIKTLAIRNTNERFEFIVRERKGDNFVGDADGIGAPPNSTLLRTPKYDGNEGGGYLLVGDGGDNPPPPKKSDEVAFVRFADTSGATISGSLYTENKKTKVVTDASETLSFTVTEYGESIIKAEFNGDEVLLKRVERLDENGNKAYFIMGESDDEDEDTKVDLPEDEITKEIIGEDTVIENETDPNAIISYLKSTLGNDLKGKFRKQKNLLLTVDSYSQSELEEIYSTVGVAAKTPKKEFIKLVETATKQLFI
jgi:hypothetical protein